MKKHYPVKYVLKSVYNQNNIPENQKNIANIIGFIVVPCFIINKITYCKNNDERNIYKVSLITPNRNKERIVIKVNKVQPLVKKIAITSIITFFIILSLLLEEDRIHILLQDDI